MIYPILYSYGGFLYYRFLYFIGSSYYKNTVGENCPISTLIKTHDECALALSYLGLQTVYLNVNEVTRPAGCYFLKRLAYKDLGFFNEIVDPESTAPDEFDGRGGVCKKEGNTSNSPNIST